MIKASGVIGGRPFLLLGLSGENMTRLMAGEPIRVDTAELDLPSMLVILIGGRTEGEITAELLRHGMVPPGM